MTQNNILLISGAILPVIITVIIGYISGKRKDFNWQQAGDINKIVMLYALPLSIFSNMVMTPRHIVMTMGPVAVAIILALILSFVIPLLVARYLFRRDLALSTLQALAIGSPAVPFIGTSVLAFLFGTVSASLITVSSITQNVFQLPLVMILMSVATGDKSQHISFGARVVNAIKQPVVAGDRPDHRAGGYPYSADYLDVAGSAGQSLWRAGAVCRRDRALYAQHCYHHRYHYHRYRPQYSGPRRLLSHFIKNGLQHGANKGSRIDDGYPGRLHRDNYCYAV
jgi:malonate transporter